MPSTFNLTSAQEIICSRIQTAAETLLNDFFTWNNTPWNCDQPSRTNIIGACVLAIANGGNLPPGFQWRDYNNNMNTITGTQMILMGQACADFTVAVYSVSWVHKANVMAMTDPAAVMTYNWAIGWPPPVNQY